MNASESLIEVVCEYTLLRGEHAYSESGGPQNFTKTHASGRVANLAFSYAAGTVIARMEGVCMAAEILDELRATARFDRDHLSEPARAAIDAPLNEVRQSVRELLALVKYHLRHFDLREGSYSVKSERWRDASGGLVDIPTTISTSFENFSNQPLDNRTHKAIQDALDDSVLPLVAMRHLHRAKHEPQPHHKWIDAAIAAELAVKEVLCRARPDMEPLLVEMPSPPLSKMYGSLLKHYLGEESPFRKILIRGQEKRNALVHRPGALQVDQQEANNYVASVEGAIFHLLSLLYPHDELIRQARDRTVA